jgi:O-antigen/teichoic acid export membrane protein
MLPASSDVPSRASGTAEDPETRLSTGSGSRPAPRLIGDALVNYSGLAVGAIVGILLVPLMLSRLGPTLYGLWLSAITVAATLRAVDFGLGLVVMREVAAASGTGLFKRTGPLVSAAGGVQLLLGLLGTALLIAGAAFLGALLRLPASDRHLVVPTFALVGVALVGEQAIAFVSSVLAGLRRFAALNALGIALALLRALGTAVLLLAGFSLLPMAAWHAGATLLVAAASLIVLGTAQGNYRLGLPGRHWRALRSHLPFGIASLASVAAAGLVWQALPLLTAALLGAGALVTVHVGQRIPLILTGLYGRLAAVIFPAASEYQRTRNVVGTRTVIETGSRLVLHMMIPVVVIGFLAAPDLFRVWIGDYSREIVLIFRLTLLAVLADALGSVAVNVLWGRGQVATVLSAAAVSALAVVAGAAIVLPLFGTAAGVALLMIVLAVVSVVFWVVACRDADVSPLQFALSTCRGLAIPALGCAVVTIALLAIEALPGVVRLLLAAAVGTGTYLALLARSGSTAGEREFAQRALPMAYDRTLPLARAVGARFPSLRSLGYLVLSLRAALLHPARRASDEFERTFAAGRDPWNYGTTEQRERIDSAMRELDAVLAETTRGTFDRAVELGCAEGSVTELLAPRCRRLVATDLSSLALARCRERCAARPDIEYQQADVARAATWGPYDLVVAMDVLECIRSPRQLRRARSAIVAMLDPGGHLLITTTRQHPVPETAWWGRWLPIGARINEFVGRHPRLQTVRSASTATHAISLYVRTA